MNSITIYNAILFLFAMNVFARQATLSEADLDYYQDQNAVMCKFLCSYFEDHKPGYQSEQRKAALFLADTLTHYPHPHAKPLKDLFLNRYKTSLDKLKSTEVENGVAVWNVYNMSYIVKSADVTAAFDLIRLPESLRSQENKSIVNALAKEMVEYCDILFVSHEHGDHMDPFLQASLYHRTNR
ncbi:hypothetical protein SMSP2_01843 [Limihaloglobus sulfuriphilus]|uniref:Metallo-beta-lactamase domain-containing protein n=1 Tax=Limihaloglobus sulfuriphilus TaxID=1851148 RepID=A0A1Q2MFN0_9BACT|nr:hypothetical protein [Limihaloglobus sulfuriphilus]AQQ71469.1 hypothetical protein SMSP2_01843 [Limihaloglobus sulfuriphilus]